MTTTTRITLEELPRHLADDLRRLADNATHAMRQAARQAETHVVEKSAEIADTGLFMQAWTVKDTPDGAILLNDAPHAQIVELGTRPSSKYPPLLPLLEYLGRRRQVSTAGVSYSDRWDLSDQPIFKQRPELESLRQQAVRLASKIKANGIPPHRIMEDSQATFRDIVAETAEAFLQE